MFEIPEMMYAKISGIESRCSATACNPVTVDAEIASRAALSPATSTTSSPESKSDMTCRMRGICDIEIRDKVGWEWKCNLKGPLSYNRLKKLRK